MTRELTEDEILATTEEIVRILRRSSSAADDDGALFALIQALPLTAGNVSKLLGAVATTAATATLEAAGVDLDDPDKHVHYDVRTRTTLPPEDTATFELAAGHLVNLGCAFILAPDDRDTAEVAALADASEDVVSTGIEYAFLTLGAMLGHLRRLLHGDFRGVMVR